ncbi:MAG: IS66 family insertion sequence element accessory protein TnpA [Polyangiales bacterium]
MARHRAAEWSERIARWELSGLTAVAFAMRERCNPRTLSWWRTELRRRARVTGRAPVSVEFARVAVVDAPSVVSSVAVTPIEFSLGDATVRVCSPVDRDALAAVVAALRVGRDSAC